MSSRLWGLLIAFLVILGLHKVMEVSTERDPSSVVLALECLVMTTLTVAATWDHIKDFGARAKKHTGHQSFGELASSLVWALAVSVGLYLATYCVLRAAGAPNAPDLMMQSHSK